jgi:cell division protein FtsN
MASRNIKNFELKLGKTGLIIVIFGTAALLCTVFLLGVDTGKNIDTYPGQIASIPQKVMARIWRPDKLKVDQNIPDNKSGQNEPPAKKNIDLTFYNTLTSKKGVVKEQPVPDRQKNAETPAEKQGEKKPQNEETGTGDLNRQDQKPSAPVIEKTDEKGKPKTKEAAPSIASPKQKFVIQAASLKEKAKAYQFNKKIAELGFEALIVPVEIKGKGTWYRVVISGFENKVQANTAAAKISKKTGTNCIIRRVDVEARKN